MPTVELIPVYHECGAVAFYTRRRMQTGDVVSAANVVHLDGTVPHPEDAIPFCPACGGSPILVGAHYREDADADVR